MPKLVDTRRVARSDRFEFWRETVCANILPIELDPRDDVEVYATMGCSDVGPLSMRHVAGSGRHVYTRNNQNVRAYDPESFQVGIPTAGSSLLVQDGKEASLSAGDIVMWDSARPYTLVMDERFRWNVFLLPKSTLRRSDAELARLTAIRIRSAEGLAGVVARFLTDLAVRSPQLESDPSADVIGARASDMVASLVRAEFDLPWSVHDPHGTLRNRAHRFIVDHHHDPGLDPAMIAAAIGVSVRTLHQVFAGGQCTVMSTVREVRLAEVRCALGDPDYADHSIGAIAASHGFTDPSVFARQFKSAYGLTARSFRSTARR